VRERVVLTRAAEGVPFDNGCFEIVEEAVDAPWPEGDPMRITPEAIAWPEDWPWPEGPAGPIKMPVTSRV